MPQRVLPTRRRARRSCPNAACRDLLVLTTIVPEKMASDPELIAGPKDTLTADANCCAVRRTKITQHKAPGRSVNRHCGMTPRHKRVVGAHDIALLTADHGLVTIQVVNVPSNTFRRVLHQSGDPRHFGGAKNQHTSMSRRPERELGIRKNLEAHHLLPEEDHVAVRELDRLAQSNIDSVDTVEITKDELTIRSKHHPRVAGRKIWILAENEAPLGATHIGLFFAQGVAPTIRAILQDGHEKRSGRGFSERSGRDISSVS